MVSWLAQPNFIAMFVCWIRAGTRARESYSNATTKRNFVLGEYMYLLSFVALTATDYITQTLFEIYGKTSGRFCIFVL